MSGKTILATGLVLLAAGVPGWAGAKLGMGGGTAMAIGNDLRIGALELFTELHGHSWLSARFAICYLPPLMPAEGPAMLVTAGARFAVAGHLRPFLVLSGGAAVEPRELGGFMSGLAWGATLGVEWWITGNFGLYASASLAVAQRDTPYGKTSYPYLPWAVGFVVASDPLPVRRLPIGVEE